LGYEHAFQPYTYSVRPFSRGGGIWRPPKLCTDSDPPAFIGLTTTLSFPNKNLGIQSEALKFIKDKEEQILNNR